MVCNNTQRDVHLIALSVICTRQLADLVRDVHDRIDIEEGVHILTHDRKAFKAHARVDILLFKFGIIALAVVIEL